MNSLVGGYDSATPLVPSLHQPALLADLVAALDPAPGDWLAGTGLAAAQFEDRPVLLTPGQWLRLLAQAERRLALPDTAFELGRRLLPGHYGTASQALQAAGNLREALETLVAHPARLSPLLTPHLLLEPEQALLVWTDAVGLGAQRGFVVDMMMSAVVALSHWQGGARLPWTLCFNRVAPRRPEQHEAYLGPQLRFGCHVDAMLLPRACLERPWPVAPEAAQHRLAASRAAAHEAHPARSLLAALHDALLQDLRSAPTLEKVAATFGTSPATLKRRLAAEGTHFQAELDLVRSHMALYWYRFRQADNGMVAQALGFHDVPNFRRSFKRWTGLTPQLLRPTLFAQG
jgi:AraC-like DNA-binding protein